MTIGLLATLKIQPGKGAEFEAAFADLAKVVKAEEPGNLQYDLFRSKEADTYVVYEQYADQAALEVHGKSDAGKAGMARMGSFLAGRPVLQFLDKV